jgi:hypothetical protein
MTKLSIPVGLFATLVLACLTSVPVAETAELPSYELTGFPISPHQFSVLGSSNVKEQSLSPSLAIGGMPPFPHQIAVLTPRPKRIQELAATNQIARDSFSTR